jgi:hypothetical protein
MVAVGSGDAGRFLAAMLESIEAEIGLTRGVRMAVDSDNPALLVEFVTVDDGSSGLRECGTRG